MVSPHSGVYVGYRYLGREGNHFGPCPPSVVQDLFTGRSHGDRQSHGNRNAGLDSSTFGAWGRRVGPACDHVPADVPAPLCELQRLDGETPHESRSPGLAVSISCQAPHDPSIGYVAIRTAPLPAQTLEVQGATSGPFQLETRPSPDTLKIGSPARSGVDRHMARPTRRRTRGRFHRTVWSSATSPQQHLPAGNL